MFTSSLRPGARSIALAAIVVASAAACSAPPATVDGGAQSAASAARQEAIDALVANTEAAGSRHDARAYHQFRVRLAAQLDAARIAGARATYRRVVADLRAAEGAHDPAARARFRAELRALCAPGSLIGVLESCHVDVPSSGN